MEVKILTNIKIVTDSSIQLTLEEINKYNITIVPLSITIDGKTYVDGVDISREEFVKLMEASHDLPTTSQPPIGTFVDVFTELTADGSQVLAIMMAESLSGTVNAARQAAEMLEDRDITVVDSGYTDRAQGQQVITAAEDIIAGKEIPDILTDLKNVEENTFLQLAVVNLENIIKGGRLGKMTGRIATLLNIKAILEMKEGELGIASKGRGQKTVTKFKEAVLELIKNTPDIVEVGLSHVDIEDEMNEFRDAIQAIKPDLPVLVAETSPIVATHTGVGAFAVIFNTEIKK